MSDKTNDTWADKSILVTGGSGFLGINLIRYLQRRGFTRITTIDIAEFDYPERNAVRSVVGDIRDANAVDSVMKGVEWVIHAAAALPLYSKDDIFSTEVNGTNLLLEAARREGVARFVYVSSTAVYGVPKSCPVTERDELVGTRTPWSVRTPVQLRRRRQGLSCHRIWQQPLSAPGR